MTEQKIQKQITTLVEDKYSGYVVKVQVASKSGVPDLITCVKGKFFAIEVKRPLSRHNVTKLQEYNIKKIRFAGGHAIVAWNEQMVDDYIVAYLI